MRVGHEHPASAGETLISQTELPQHRARFARPVSCRGDARARARPARPWPDQGTPELCLTHQARYRRRRRAQAPQKGRRCRRLRPRAGVAVRKRRQGSRLRQRRLTAPPTREAQDAKDAAPISARQAAEKQSTTRRTESRRAYRAANREKLKAQAAAQRAAAKLRQQGA